MPTTPRAGDQRGRRLFTILIAVVALFAPLASTSPAEAFWEPSANCENAYQPDRYIPLVSGDLGLPLWLSLTATTHNYGDSASGSFNVCYGTGAPEDTKIIGGVIGFYPWLSYDPENPGVAFDTVNRSDSNSALGSSFQVFAMPWGDAEAGGQQGGQAFLFRTSVMVCLGDYPNQICEPDYATRNVQDTGVVLGTITKTPAGTGGMSAAWRVSSMCLMVDGVPVTDCNGGIEDTGVTTTGTSPVTSSASYGPCVLSICIPTNVNYLGTTGKKLATVYVPEVGAIPVNGVRLCVFQKDPNTQCPA